MNKSLIDETFTSTRKSSYRSKNHNKNENKIILDSMAFKKINSNKIIKTYAYKKKSNSKEKTSNIYIDSISIKNEKGKNYNKSKINIKKLKLLTLKTFKENKPKKLKIFFHKNNSISISNKNNINNGLIINDISKKKGNYNLQNEFKEYKKHTNKIINELKNKVEQLQKTIIKYDKEKIKDFIKEKDFNKAFNLALKLDNVQDMYYILKEYNLFTNENKINKFELNIDLLDKIINFLCRNIYSFKNLNVVFLFILQYLFIILIQISRKLSI